MNSFLEHIIHLHAAISNATHYFKGQIIPATFLFFLIFALSSQANGQFHHRVVDQITVNEGLSQNDVLAIAQDSLGFLWIGTMGGLNRHDGNSFNQYLFYFSRCFFTLNNLDDF